jgi:hypothetical protein
MPRGGGVCVPIGVLVSASLDEQFMSEAEECTPSEAEGWRYKHWSSRLGFARRTVYERSRGTLLQHLFHRHAYLFIDSIRIIFR